MKRFHVHLHVQDLAQSIAFYSRLFAQQPSRSEVDYAKWMLTDPPVNFAISSRSGTLGLDHLGFQVEDAAELGALKTQAQQAQLPLLDEGVTQCCYAESDKFWLTDPQGVSWEHFHTQGQISSFNGEDQRPSVAPCCTGSACVPAAAPAAAPKRVPLPVVAAPAPACCAPAGTEGSSCC